MVFCYHKQGCKLRIQEGIRDMKISVTCTKQDAFDSKSQAVAYFLQDSFASKDLDSTVKDLGIDVAAYLKESKFTGSKGSVAALPVTFDGKKYTHLFFAGFGKKGDDKKYCFEQLRRAIGSAVKFSQGKNLESIALVLPESKLFGLTADEFVQQVYTVASIAAYKFDDFKDKKDKKEKSIAITLCPTKTDQKGIKKGEEFGSVIAEAVNRARHWIDTPPSRLTPTGLAGHAKQLARTYGLKCTIFDEKKINELGMGGLAGVAAGSSQDAKFVILEYKSKKAKAPTIGFVGKGITFDSGGLSLKPANYMETMKEDMAGSACVINTLAAVAQLKADVNVIGLVALTENMPGCSATKPGDVVTFYNGKTAEVLNTDAEGRLVLADALAYGVKHYKLDAIIDVATLTGACIYAVGPFYSALLSDNKKLADKVTESANRSGDYVWSLPFNDDFKSAVKSDVADIKNIGSPAIAAGTITAACFLREFSGDTPWVHLDIASTAFNVPNLAYYGKGATGSSVRLMIDLAMNWKK